MAERYRKKPVEIEATILTDTNAGEVAQWITQNGQRANVRGGPRGGSIEGTVIVHTLEGNMTASVGDLVIKGVQGEFYPCKPDIFAATYEPIGATDD